MKALLTISACAAIALVGCGDDDTATSASATDTKTKPTVEVPKGPPPKKLVKNELIEGSGRTAKAGDLVTVEYLAVDYATGKEVESSWARGAPFPFGLGSGEAIPGWDQGIEGMKVGGRRELILPPNLAYGKAGLSGVVGPNATVVFVIDLLKISDN